ncbi:MAG: AraC family transcriptional regulator [Flavitalea sp.]
MLTPQEKIIIEDYKKAVKRYYRDMVVIELAKVIKLDYWIMRVEKILAEAGSFNPPHRHSKFTIVYIVAGEGKKTIGSLTVPIKSRTLMFVPPRVVTSSFYSLNTEGYYLTFNLKFFLQEHFPAHHLLNMDLFARRLVPYAYLPIKLGQQVTEIFEIILDERDHQRRKKEELIALKILELIIICERVLKTEKITRRPPPPPAARFVDLVQKHYKQQHSTHYYAEKLHMHPNSLNATTKRYLGQSAKATINAFLITEAKQLLHQTGLSVKEMAFELGFHSDSHFLRFFKIHTGVTPSTYRQKKFENVVN